ncbi:toxin-antitoxin system YwqK family antitoxin [Fusobacterium canifelinum]|uniref:Toxin-antitoxin system YwqK family antitoxin n=1 Tax=Fusobacterium canifelinum TaxID=285729 RepID=A0A3P1USB3_9FUSO|nr:hypothetical protein [Fusobacterium canifelinum]QQB74280.1 hypothetical protein I6H56_02055 [Fusobacterium canifelinum]QQS87792.1 hypothetical protein I6I83_01200 [Fusobacterium canifelinum]RRD24076.1 hypothetical protein EII27_07580 [Fusobacterium canifelinum]
MKKFLILLFSLFSIFTYAAKNVNETEVNKYIRQKLDRDKTITFTNKLNKTNNTLEGYSDEGVLCAVTPLNEQPHMINLLDIKSTISEKKGKLKPIYEIRNNNNQLLVRSEYDLSKPINIFETELFLAYFHGQVPFNSEVENLINSINSIKTEINYFDTNSKGYQTYVINHKTNKIRIEDKTKGFWVVTNFDIKTLNGTREFFSENGKLQSTHPLKNGIPHGEFKGYRENGTLLVKATLVNGDFSGTVTQYNEDGSIEKTFDSKEFDLNKALKK